MPTATINLTRPYKEYIALLSQSGTNAPTAIEIANTIGTITLAYVAVGTYKLVSSGLFTLNKTHVMIDCRRATTIQAEIINANEIYFTTRSGAVQVNIGGTLYDLTASALSNGMIGSSGYGMIQIIVGN